MSQQFTVGHFWLLHLKNTPRLNELAEDSAEIINEKKAFYSGAMAALGFSKLSLDMRDGKNQEIINVACRAINNDCSAYDSIETAVNNASANIADMVGKTDSLIEEVGYELVKLKNATPAPQLKWWQRKPRNFNN